MQPQLRCLSLVALAAAVINHSCKHLMAECEKGEVQHGTSEALPRALVSDRALCSPALLGEAQKCRSRGRSGGSVCLGCSPGAAGPRSVRDRRRPLAPFRLRCCSVVCKDLIDQRSLLSRGADQAGGNKRHPPGRARRGCLARALPHAAKLPGEAEAACSFLRPVSRSQCFLVCFPSSWG